MSYISLFLKSQLFTKLPYPDSDFTGQTIIVTGANTGLGYEAAKHLVRLNAAKVILAVRTVSKGEAAANAICEALRFPRSRVEVWEVDLADYKSIKAFGTKVNTLDRLDACIQNAGILTTRFTLVNGHESNIAVNVIGATLLGLLVLPKLRQSGWKTGLQGRLAFVGSDLQYVAKFNEKNTSGSLFEALNDQWEVDMEDRYKVSKLLLLYAVRTIAEESHVNPPSNVIIDYVTPGACKSDIFRDDTTSFASALALKIGVALIARTTEQGSRTLVHAIKPDIGEHSHGRFLMNCKVLPNGNNVDSDWGRNMQAKLVQELWTILERISPGVTNI